MKRLWNSLVVGAWCGLVTASLWLVFPSVGGLAPVLCAATSGALLGGPLLRAEAAGKAALRGLTITFGAYWLYMFVLLFSESGSRDIGTWLFISLYGLVFVGWVIFPVGAIGAALLWSLNLRVTRRIRSRRLEAAAAEMDLKERSRHI